MRYYFVRVLKNLEPHDMVFEPASWILSKGKPPNAFFQELIHEERDEVSYLCSKCSRNLARVGRRLSNAVLSQML